MATLERRIVVPTPNQSPYVLFSISDISNSYNNIHISPEYGERDIPHVFKLISGSISLATSAAVANRTIMAYLAKYEKGSNGDAQIRIGPWVTGNIAASQTGRLSLQPGGTLTGASLSDNTDVEGTVEWNPDGSIISGSDLVSITINSMQAGDLYSVCLLFEYLNHKLGITEK